MPSGEGCIRVGRSQARPEWSRQQHGHFDTPTALRGANQASLAPQLAPATWMEASLFSAIVGWTQPRPTCAALQWPVIFATIRRLWDSLVPSVFFSCDFGYTGTEIVAFDRVSFESTCRGCVVGTTTSATNSIEWRQRIHDKVLGGKRECSIDMLGGVANASVHTRKLGILDWHVHPLRLHCSSALLRP